MSLTINAPRTKTRNPTKSVAVFYYISLYYIELHSIYCIASPRLIAAPIKHARFESSALRRHAAPFRFVDNVNVTAGIRVAFPFASYLTVSPETTLRTLELASRGTNESTFRRTCKRAPRPSSPEFRVLRKQIGGDGEARPEDSEGRLRSINELSGKGWRV